MRLTLQDVSRLPSVTKKKIRQEMARADAPKVPKLSLSPQEMLWDAIEAKWPGRATWELTGAIPGRQYRIDIAFEAEKLAIEVDGYGPGHFGKKGYLRDRKKDVLLTRLGWRVLRFATQHVRKDGAWVMESIEEVLDGNRERD